ncbi:MAG: hypothetical protein EZS28_043673 [Streblomastix strix]|uniref:Uncharacterized protein n=1 Tax=Streblomastix strix TaxID=222440 RepID=A0A5J4TS51_9EUKA|nr:MAG: hypothetical protein EZS28_043673 [Streblomastix strix]
MANIILCPTRYIQLSTDRYAIIEAACKIQKIMPHIKNRASYQTFYYTKTKSALTFRLCYPNHQQNCNVSTVFLCLF